ncbi:MAG: hypothetical protein IKI51_02665, partial [Clostridia bacterium]|nr:hypothetical protein [Clostridia bacterium]
VTGVVRLDERVVFLLDLEAIVATLHPGMAIRMEERAGQEIPEQFTILHADDSSSIRRLVAQLLEKEGRFKLIQAVDGQEAWEKLGFYVVLRACDAKEYEDALNSKSYDIIGLDWQMLSPYPLYDLAPFATTYSGFVTENDDGTYTAKAGLTGWSNSAYNELIDSAFAATKQKDKAAILHDAEKLLLEEGAIVPVVFNSECYVVSNKLSGITKNYFGSKIFTRTALKNYEKYLALIPSKKYLFD